MSFQLDVVSPLRRLNTVLCQNDIASPRRHVKTAPCQNGVVSARRLADTKQSKRCRNKKKVVPSWCGLNTAPCKHGVVSKRIRANSKSYQYGVVPTRRRVDIMSFQKLSRVKTVACQDDVVSRRHRVKTVSCQHDVVSRHCRVRNDAV